MNKRIFVVCVVALVGCKQRVELYCESHADCAEWGLDFCDLEGDYPASEGIGRTCIDNPFDASIPDGGLDAGPDAGDVPATCDPGSRVCDGDRLVICDEAGQVSEFQDCAAGCSEELARCLRMEPSNDLAMYLELSASEPALELSNGAVIDTTAGTITDAEGTPIPVKTELLDAPADGVELRVFWASSVTIGSVEVKGDPALAIVAAGPIDVFGSISLRAAGVDRSCRPSTINADSDPERLCVGNAGGSFGARGGNGGGVNNPGTSDDNEGAEALAPVGAETLTPLRGGCSGGSISFAAGPVTPGRGGSGGAGGGALQLSSASVIRIGADDRAGAILANGFAGQAPQFAIDPCGGGGGGSGGALLLEAPVVDVPFDSILLANGAGGGCAAQSGSRPPISGTAAEGGTCASGELGNGGRGGTAATPATNGLLGTDPGDDPDVQDRLAGGGGGGGSIGRIRINTRSGSFSSDALISPRPSVGTIMTE